MVLIEEFEEPEEVSPEPKSAPAPAAPKDTLKKGFLDGAEELYPPEGSPEGAVAPETHKAHGEHKMNEDLNAGMYRGAKDNNGVEPPEWYNKEWPKGCQYNAPGCTLGEMSSSGHMSDLHRDMCRSERWQKAMAPGVDKMLFSFTQFNDEDVALLVERLKGDETVTEIDLSHNKIKDTGVQALVGALANGAAKNLKELRLHNNEFTDMGETMLHQGLKVFRKKLEVVSKAPDYSQLAANFSGAKPEVQNVAPAASVVNCSDMD